MLFKQIKPDLLQSGYKNYPWLLSLSLSPWGSVVGGGGGGSVGLGFPGRITSLDVFISSILSVEQEEANVRQPNKPNASSKCFINKKV
jgi:hypothetical protein